MALLALLAAAAPAVRAAPAAPAAAADLQPLLRIGDPRVVESSGLAASRVHPGVLWTVNDSGGQPVVYGVDGGGRTVAEIALSGVQQRDWEALAPTTMPDGRAALLIGDIGDNSGTRDDGLLLHLVPEPAGLGLVETAPARSYRLRFEDGPRDAEALAVDPLSGRVYVVSKALLGGAVYAADALVADGTTVLRRLVRSPALVTDAACLPDGRLVLRGYQSAQVLGRDLRRVAGLDLPSQPQGETLAVTPDGSALLVGSEGEDSAVYRVPLPSDLPPATSTAPAEQQPPATAEPSAEGVEPSAEAAGAGTGADPEPAAEQGGASTVSALLLALLVAAAAGFLLRTRAMRRFLRRR